MKRISTDKKERNLYFKTNECIHCIMKIINDNTSCTATFPFFLQYSVILAFVFCKQKWNAKYNRSNE